jgi:2-methylcitrate dehydratase PrpD
MTWALGIAATQAAGLSAALMAQAGFTSSTQAIEGPRGFAKVMSSEPREELLLAEIGTRCEPELA